MLTAKCRLLLKKVMALAGLGEEVANAIDFATTDPFGVQRGGVYKDLDLTALGAKYVRVTTLPAGSIIRYIGWKIQNVVVAGGTTVKVGMGQNDGDMDAYGKSSALTAGLHVEALYNDATPLAADLPIDLTFVTTAGTALGDTNVSAGRVTVSIRADTPAILPTAV